MLTDQVSRRLEENLGLGEFPMIRRRLYQRVQRACVKFGDQCLVIVGQLLEEAKSLRDRRSNGPATRESKGKWFSRAVVARLKENDMWDEPSANQTQAQAEEQRKAIGQLRDGLAGQFGEGAL